MIFCRVVTVGESESPDRSAPPARWCREKVIGDDSDAGVGIRTRRDREGPKVTVDDNDAIETLPKAP